MQAVCSLERQVIGWFEASKPEAFTPAKFPVFILDDPSGLFYGFPAFGHAGFKIGKMQHQKQHTTADGLDRNISADEEQVGLPAPCCCGQHLFGTIGFTTSESGVC